MVGEDLVVEHLVAVVQLVEVDVPVQVAVEAVQLGVAAGGLLVEGLDGDRQPADEAESLAVLHRERGAAVGQGIGHHGGLAGHCGLLVDA